MHKKNLQARAELYRNIRQFFYEREVLEVETPLLSIAATVDPHIDSLNTDVMGQRHYLQTSPEFFLKRLLAEGSGDIYSLGKVFRQGEKGRRHHPEFTMLEWYRIAWDEHQLMAELEALIKGFLPKLNVSYLSYADCFLKNFNIDPHHVDIDTLKAATHAAIEIDFDSDEKTAWLDLLMSHCIEPNLPEGLVFIYDYPKEQAALAKLTQNQQGQTVARRFELYLDGVELANGYNELTDAKEQQARFEADIEYRKANQLPIYPYDKKLVTALQKGMPACAGVALGLDRLLMRLCNTNNINDVLSFSE